MINTKDFIVLEPENRRKQYAVNVLESGKINLNGYLNESLQDRKVQVCISKDGNIMLLIPNASEKTYVFPKSGSVKNEEIVHILRKKRFQFPVRYVFKWDDMQKLWIGKTEKVGNDTVEK